MKIRTSITALALAFLAAPAFAADTPKPADTAETPTRKVAVTVTFVRVGEGNTLVDERAIDSLPLVNKKDIERFYREDDGKMTNLYRIDRLMADGVRRDKDGKVAWLDRTNYKDARILAILDDESAQSVLHALGQMKNADTVKLATLYASDKKSYMLENVRDFRGAQDAWQFNTGVSVEVNPTMHPEGEISLDMSFRHTTVPHRETIEGEAVPLVWRREFPAWVTVPSGATVLFGGRTDGDEYDVAKRCVKKFDYDTEDSVKHLLSEVMHNLAVTLERDTTAKDWKYQFAKYEYFFLVKATIVDDAAETPETAAKDYVADSVGVSFHALAIPYRHVLRLNSEFTRGANISLDTPVTLSHPVPR